MPEHDLGYRPSGGADDAAVFNELNAFEAALRSYRDAASSDGDGLAQADQLARDIAEIERATAALRKAEPALESWQRWTEDRAAATAPKQRPVWVLIGLLWLSTALVTAGAVAAIARLAG